MIRHVVAVCVVVGVAYGYSSGAPEGVCGDMVPKHPGSPQKGKAPYSVQLDRTEINGDQLVQVTIAGNGGETFKGFFVQGRVGGVPVGSFEKIAGINLKNCGQGVKTAATHINSDDKKQVVLKWKAPRGLSESVYFNTTIVKDGTTYWVGLLSPRLQVSRGTN